MRTLIVVAGVAMATATMASAEIKVSGYGRFGLDYNDRNGHAINGISKTTLTTRLRMQIDASTVTDGGVTLGARFRFEAESRDNTPNTAVANGPYMYARYGNLTVGVGNILGAIDAMPGFKLPTASTGIGIDGAGFHDEVGNVAVNVPRQFSNWDAYSSTGAGANGIEVIYKAGAFAGHLSYSEDNGPRRVGRTAMYLAYTLGHWTAVLAGQASDTAGEDKTILAVMGKFGPIGVRVAYADNEGIDKVGVYADFDVGTASSIVLFATSEDAADAGAIAQGRDNRDVTLGNKTGGEGESWGIHYSYDLGGGASLEAGAVRSSNDQTQVQAGVYFKF